MTKEPMERLGFTEEVPHTEMYVGCCRAMTQGDSTGRLASAGEEEREEEDQGGARSQPFPRMRDSASGLMALPLVKASLDRSSWGGD